MAGRRETVAARASMVATRMHQELESESLRVPVFDVVRDRGIWLMTQPMSWNTYGFSMSDGSVAGIFLNAEHSEPMRRFTCAHELGHLVLGHQLNVDHASDVENSLMGSDQEVQAQAFASSFLMPVPNVYRAMTAVGIEEERVEPVHSYMLSRILDVSFAAMCWRLVELELITTDQARMWVKRGPKHARKALSAVASDRDVTVITPELFADALGGRVGDLWFVDFGDRSDTGFVWQLEGAEASSAKLDWDGESTINSMAVEVDQQTVFWSAGPLLELEREGAIDVALELVRPWEGRPAAEVNVHVDVYPTHEFGALHQNQRQFLGVDE